MKHRCLIFILEMIFLLASAVFQKTASAQVASDWRWFFAAFCAPRLEAGLCVHSGLAKVRIEHGRIDATLLDSKVPEMRLTFEGRFEKQKNIDGMLVGLASHEPSQDRYRGSHSYLQMGKSCKSEQILLMPAVPDGTVLSLSRVQGLCQ